MRNEDSDPMAKVGRLALRQEGTNWCAYYALPGTMKHALALGSIRLAIVTKNSERKKQFLRLMSESVADIIENSTGATPDMGDPEAAPERERSGHA